MQNEKVGLLRLQNKSEKSNLGFGVKGMKHFSNYLCHYVDCYWVRPNEVHFKQT